MTSSPARQNKPKRRLGLFSSFALSFSIISVTTGLFANYGTGLQAAGPMFVWTWLIVGAGQALVAGVMAYLSRSIPLSGYAYQWTRQLAGKQIGWWAGWLMLVQFLSGMPAVCLALATTLAGYLGFALNSTQLALATVAVMFSIAVVNHLGVKVAARINDVSVIAEVVGTVAVGIALLWFALARHVHSVGFLFVHPHQSSGMPYFAAFVSASLMAAWTLTGFEGAANLAEETHLPERIVPIAILGAELVSVLVGFLVLVGFTLAMPSLDSTIAQPAPLFFIMSAYFPNWAIAGVMIMVAIAIYACALANLTAVARMVWAMARDRQLPGSRWLGALNRDSTPVNAIWISTAIAAAFTIWARLEAVITAVSVLAGYLTYALIAISALAGRNASIPTADGRNKPLVPRWLSTLAVLWLLIFVGFLTIPRSNWASVNATAVSVAVGIVFFVWTRRTRRAPGTDSGTAEAVSILVESRGDK
jgi:amino acid transporter